MSTGWKQMSKNGNIYARLVGLWVGLIPKISLDTNKISLDTNAVLCSQPHELSFFQVPLT